MKCPNCGKEMEKIIDPITKEVTGYLYHCECMSDEVNISIG